LDLEGIRVEHPTVLKKTPAGNWLVHQCVNCDMMTHAIHTRQGHNKILVNMSLKSDPTIIEHLQRSPDFSKLYKIVLHNRIDNRVGPLDLQSGRYESVQKTLATIQQQLNKFLMTEEAAMEDRIRAFEQQQRDAYAELQSKARRDKNTMISLVLAAEDYDSKLRPSLPLGGAFKTSRNHDADGFEASTESVDEPPRAVHKKVMSELHKRPSFETGKRGQTMSQPNRLGKASKQQHFSTPKSSSSPEGDAMFDLDGIDGDSTQPFYESDDEVEDTDDSMNEDSGIPMIGRPAGRSIYSSSVPITVPAWRKSSTSEASLEEDDDEDNYRGRECMDPEQMAASIKALARSVHTDGSEIFGERPRPRLNTMDMGKL
jgi:hypothetical protein